MENNNQENDSVNKEIDEETGRVTDEIQNVTAQELMKKNYLNYAMSVIMARALPDVRDGLKPVHRRILYAMHELKMFPNSQYKKSARMVGDVIGKYHPHGDTSVYDAAVIMAQWWSKSIPLIDGQGNFGSMDNDGAAAMRYTEMRLSNGGMAFFNDIEKNTVEFQPNYDGSEKEPALLPVTFPNILVNGVDGIAVGMATYIPTHNLNECVDLAIALQENPNLSIDEMLKIMPAPDFPTGGVVHDLAGYREAMETGRGAVKVRAKWHEELTKSGMPLLVIDELPFKVNKEELISRITERAKNKDAGFEDITDINDESDKGSSVRIVIDLKRDAVPAVVFNYLVKNTKAEETYNYNMMLLEGKAPKQMNLKEILLKFLEFRTEIVVKRINFDLAKAKARLHILSGMKIVLEHMQEAVDIIMKNKDSKSAKEALIERFSVDDLQAQAVLDLKLQRLTGMEIDSILDDLRDFNMRVEDMNDILKNPVRIQYLVRKDMIAAKEKFGVDRKSEISYENNDINMADLVKKEDCLIHLTKNGYMKRMPMNLLETQNRSGKGRSGINAGDGDYVSAIYSGSTHDMFMVFTESGQAMASYLWNLPDGTTANRGRHLRNIFETLKEDVASVLLLPEIEEGISVITVTEKGKVKRTALSDYTGTMRKKGVQGVTIDEGDKLVNVMLAKRYDHILLVSSTGKAVRFEIDDEALQIRGRKSVGVKGIDLGKGAKVVSSMVIESNGAPMPIIDVEKERMNDAGVIEKYIAQEEDTSHMDNGKYVLCIGENGVGKRTSISEFSAHSRGTKGVTCFNINDKTGNIAKALIITDEDNVMLTTKTKMVRLHVSDIRVTGRNTAGTILMNVGKEKIADVIQVPALSEEEEIEAMENEVIDLGESNQES